MCFLPVKGKRGVHKHIQVAFIRSMNVNKKKLGDIADFLGFTAASKRKLKAGKLHIVNEPARRVRGR
jgi:hypothetical protein